jgi:hypothetical protein
MTDEIPALEPRPESPAERPLPVRAELLPLPGLAAIALYLLVLAGVIVVGVVGGRHYPPLFLMFAAAFITVLLLVVYNLWIFSTLDLAPALVQGLLNLVFFLYLVRTEVRTRLR